MTETTVQEEVEAIESADMDVEEVGREQKKSQFVQLRAKGLSYAKIAKELKVSKSTLSNWCQELQAEIAQAKAMELEALQEEYYLLKEGRIKLLGGQLKAIQEEMVTRDLSKVNTDKLLELQLRYFGELKTEYVEVRPEDKTGTKLNSKDVAERLQSVLARYKAGQMREAQAKQEQTILQSMLKAIEQTELEARLEKIEAVLRSRR
jgi:transposase